MYPSRVFGTAKCVLFIKVSSFQGVLNKGLAYSGNTLYIEGKATSQLCIDVREFTHVLQASNGFQFVVVEI